MSRLRLLRLILMSFIGEIFTAGASFPGQPSTYHTASRVAARLNQVPKYAAAVLMAASDCTCLWRPLFSFISWGQVAAEGSEAPYGG